MPCVIAASLAGVTSGTRLQRPTLLEAVVKGNDRQVKTYLDEGASANEVILDGETLLMAAASEGRLAVVDLLVRRGADLERIDRPGMTALGHAVHSGKTAIATRLIALGAKVDGRPRGMPPIEAAALGQSVEGIALLLQKGASVNRTDRWGNTALIIATRVGNIDIVRQLLRAGANRDTRDNHGFAALDYATKAKRQDLVKTLASQPS